MCELTLPLKALIASGLSVRRTVLERSGFRPLRHRETRVRCGDGELARRGRGGVHPSPGYRDLDLLTQIRGEQPGGLGSGGAGAAEEWTGNRFGE